MLFFAFAILVELKTNFAQLFFVLARIVRNLFTHRTFKLCEIVLGHILLGYR